MLLVIKKMVAVTGIGKINLGYEIAVSTWNLDTWLYIVIITVTCLNNKDFESVKWVYINGGDLPKQPAINLVFNGSNFHFSLTC